MLNATMLGVSWLWWGIGTLGLGGIILLAVLWFTVGPVIVSKILNAIGYALVLAWSSRIGVGIIVGALAFFVADTHRSRLDEADWAKQTSEFNKRAAMRDKLIADQTRADVTAELQQQQVADVAADKEVKEFHDALPPVPALNNPFVVGSNAGRLRSLYGQSGRRSQRIVGAVPAARPRSVRRRDR
jgi:hypothetical protein